jgi:hypothetical protein
VVLCAAYEGRRPLNFTVLALLIIGWLLARRANSQPSDPGWNEFKTNNIDAMIDELIRSKKAHYPDDRRRILTCGIPDGKACVKWLAPAAPRFDSKWEMQLYGLVRSGEKAKAIRFLQETRRLSRDEASKRVAQLAAELGMK